MYFLFLATIFFLPLGSRSQQSETVYMTKALLREDSLTMASLSAYPAKVRESILQVCTQSDGLIKLSNLQKQTSAEFTTLLQPLKKEEQEKIWDISRYPGLVTAIAKDGPKTHDELEKIAQGYPKSMHDKIIDLGKHQYDLLVKIDRLNQRNQQAFETLISGYDQRTRSAFTTLLQYPDAIALLTENMRTTLMLGQIYNRDENILLQKMDSIGVANAEQNKKDLEEWKKGLENNPDAKKEMDASAKEFENYVSYDGSGDGDDVYNRSQTVIVEVYQPYPYWFGYPWWYDYPCWYPYPWWYHCGYYWGPYGVVYVGFPSPFYMHWYLHNYHHHYYYNHFTDYCVGHYYGHRNTPSEFNHSVRQWVNSNKYCVPSGFFNNDNGRPERIKEFGKFETDYQQAVLKDPGTKLSREEFLKSNGEKYPSMRPSSTYDVPGKKQPTPPVRPYQPPVNKKPTNNPMPPAKPKQPGNKAPSGQPRNIPTTPKPRPSTQPKPQAPRGGKLPGRH